MSPVSHTPFRILAGSVAIIPVLHLLSTIDNELTDEGKAILRDWRIVFAICFGVSYTATGGDRLASIAASAIVVGVSYELLEARPKLLEKYFTRYKNTKEGDK